MRYTLTPEEFALVEKLRAKNQAVLGYNEGLETACQQVLVWTDHLLAPSEEWRRTLVEFIRSLKREPVL